MLSAISFVNSLPSTQRRVFRSHSPLSLISSWTIAGNKVLYLSRNPKDVSVSLWLRALTPLPPSGSSSPPSPAYDGPFSHFLSRVFLPGRAPGGDWYSHVISYVTASHWQSFVDREGGGGAPPVGSDDSSYPGSLTAELFHLSYEAFQAAPVEGVFGVGEFLGVSLNQLSDARCKTVKDLAGLSAMRDEEKRKGVRGGGADGGAAALKKKLLGRGGVGGWKDFFTVRQNETFHVMHDRRMKARRGEGVLMIDFEESGESKLAKKQAEETDELFETLGSENDKTCSLM